MVRFALPMILGNMLQQVYNLTDTLLVGRFVGSGALAAVGAAYALMVFLNSVQLGLCMGSGAVFSVQYGAGERSLLRSSLYVSFVLIAGVTLVLNAAVFAGIDPLMRLLQVPPDIYGMMREYLWIVFWGIGFTFLYNYFASVLRALGESFVPLLALLVSVVANIGLDLLFICVFRWGIAGAAWATVVAQAMAALSLAGYTLWRRRDLLPRKGERSMALPLVRSIASYSLLTCLQQSVMNFGILMVQGLVNSFGTVVMAAFAAAVKIDTLAYMPAQDFGNAFSTFIAQNFGARKPERIRRGIRQAVRMTVGFCLLLSAGIYVGAEWLMRLFVPAGETEIVRIGAEYLRIEGAFYCGIGILFLFYGYFRAVQQPAMSLVLTVISLGSRVVLAYTLSAVPGWGVDGIWWSIPIGWLLADLFGWWRYRAGAKKG